MHHLARPHHRILRLGLAGAIACGGASAAPTPTPVPVPLPAVVPAEPAAPQFVPISDASTVAIARMANNVELAYARIAAAAGTRLDVRAFARREVTAHTQLNSALMRRAATLDIVPRDDEVSRLLRDQSLARRDSLRATRSGRRFDSTYVANEVRYHRELLVAVDSVFLRSVRHAGLEDYLTVTLRPEISAHLARALRLQATLATRK